MSFKATLKSLSFIFSLIIFGFFLSVNICNAQYPYNFGIPYGAYGSGVGAQNIPIITPFMRVNVDSINFYSPYGYGTNSASPYLMSGLLGPYGGGPYGGGLYGPYGGLYGGFYGLYGGLYGMGSFIGPGLFNRPFGFGGFGFPWFL
jgi:hypothetical protein